MSPIKTQLLVLGAGPGGYTAAFNAADHGQQVVLVEQEKQLGGVCLNRGCIPSKALLHATSMLTEARDCAKRGLHFAPPRIDLDQLRSWKGSILQKLTQGVSWLAQKRGVQVITGRGHFEDSRTLRVETAEGQVFVEFAKAIIAVGSRPAMPKAFDLGNPRVMTSTEALDIPDIPERLLVIGGGYIGMELGTVYASLGSQVIVAEALDTILAGADPDLVRPVLRYAEQHFKEIRLKAQVAGMATAGKQIEVAFQMDGKRQEERYDRVLVSVGRVPNGDDLGLENTRVTRDDKGYIQVNPKQQTADPDICAIGDVVGGVLLAHKASREARVAVETLLGETATAGDTVIPAVVFTHPELAWCGLTEADAKARNLTVQIAKFPWTASGRAMTFDHTEGFTKLVVDPESERILGVGIVGHGAGELISEGVVAIEMGATALDLAECVHPHPTLSETLMECAEAFYGRATHTYAKKPA
ncbi:MAG: dihydrolipoyl dehydrogenase [Verrucomicrobia bacterium]|nr:dihydrolipoyl dehydrogenase [Verrucomicrobiota bacterium]